MGTPTLLRAPVQSQDPHQIMHDALVNAKNSLDAGKPKDEVFLEFRKTAMQLMLSHKSQAGTLLSLRQAFISGAVLIQKADATGIGALIIAEQGKIGKEDSKEEKSKFYNDVPVNARKELSTLMFTAQTFVQKLDGASADSVKQAYQNIINRYKIPASEVDAALLGYLKQAKPELFGSMASFNIDEFDRDVWASSSMVSSLNDWMSNSHTTSADLLALQTAFTGNDSDAQRKTNEAWLKKIGLPPAILTNRYFGTMLLRQYGVASASELHASLMSKASMNVIPAPEGNSVSDTLGVLHQCFDIIEKSGLLANYRGDSKYYNGKFESLNVAGKFAFLTSSLGWIAQKSDNAASSVDTVLTDAGLLTPAGQIAHLSDAMPQVLAYFSDSSRIGQVSNALRGTAILYGNAYDFQANGEKEYFKEVGARLNKSFMDYLENLRRDLYIGGLQGRANDVPGQLKVQDPWQRISGDWNNFAVTPQSLDLTVFQNLALQSYLDATVNRQSSGLGDGNPFGSPTVRIDQFFRTGLTEFIPNAAMPRKEDWYGPPFDSLIRELTRVDLTKHYASKFDTSTGSNYVTEERYNSNYSSKYAMTFTLYRDLPQNSTQLTATGNDLSTGDNWTVQNISGAWNMANGVDTSVQAELNAYAGKDANVLLFMQNNYQTGQYLVNAYVRKGNYWARFFSQDLTKQDMKQQYGRVFMGAADVETDFENNKLSGAVVGLNLSSLGIPSGAIAGAATPQNVFGKGLSELHDDVGAGAYMLLGKNLDPGQQPVVFARYTKTSGREVGGATFVSKPFYAELSKGDQHFDIDLGYKNKTLYLRGKYVDSITQAYSTTPYGTDYTPDKGRKVKASSLEGQYDWGQRNTMYAIYNTLDVAANNGTDASINRENAVVGFKIAGGDKKFGDKFFTQASYSYDPDTYGTNAMGYLRNLYGQSISDVNSVADARSQTQTMRDNFQRVVQTFDPITQSVVGNMVKTLKADYRHGADRYIGEAIMTNKGDIYNLGFQLGKVTIGGTLATSDYGQMLAAQISGKDIAGLSMVKATLAVPSGHGNTGANVNIGVEKGNLRLFGSYTNLELVARGIANQINSAGDVTVEDAYNSSPISLQTKVKSTGFGAEYRKDNTNFYIIFTKSESGAMNAVVTDNPQQTISGLTGVTAGATMYSFNENGLRNAWTLGAFAEKTTIQQLVTEANKQQSSNGFYANQYGIISKWNYGDGGYLTLKGGLEFYPGGKSYFGSVTYKWFF